MKKFFIFVSVIVVLAASACFVVWNDYNRYLETPLNIAEESTFKVEKGSSFNGLIKRANQEGLQLNELYFKLYGRQSGLNRKLKAGEYRLQPGLTPVSFLALVTSGRSITYNFTIIEGSTFKQLREALKQNKHLNDDISSLSDKALLEKIGVSEKNPEGLFMAETYSFERSYSALQLLKRANQYMQTTLDKHWQARDKKLPYKRAYEALIMASIVEKETARADERPIIAGVFVRRLNKKMRLQTDPTVIYGMGDKYKGNIRRSDLRRPTPYNTYVIPALPPTPIAMVGAEAIEAALNPEPGKALYFVAKGDGSHYFSATLKEHNNAVRRYQLTRRKDYRSSP